MSLDIRKSFFNGVLWNFLEKVLVKSLSFVIGIILARLLSPSDFGLIGMLTIFVAISNVFIESGFSKALIQKQDLQEVDLSTAFITNVITSIVIYIILYFSAPLIANFYNEPILCGLMRVLGLNFIVGSLNIVQRAKMMKFVDFKSLASIATISTAVGGVVGIYMAYADFGVWSLVGQTISATLAQVFIFPFFSRWRPVIKFSLRSFKELFGYGSKLMITGVASVIVNNISSIAIGKVYDSAKLGYYTRASQFSEFTAMTIYEVIGNVSFPILSGLQSERDRLVYVYKKSLFFTAMIVFPIMVLIALLAKPIIVILLTEKWLPCAFMMQILCIARMFTPLSAINMNILNAIGRPDLFMKLDFAKMPLVLIALAITIPMGLHAIVIGTLITTIICFFINAFLPGKLFGYGAIKQLKDWRYIFLSLILMMIVVVIVTMLIDNVWLLLVVGGLLGLGSYAMSILCFRVITLQEIKYLLIKK